MVDITFIGHMCYDEIQPFGGAKVIAPGSAVLCGAMVAARVGKKVSAVVKMSPVDTAILDPLCSLDVDVRVIPSDVTTYSVVIHPSENVDERVLLMPRSAGLISCDSLPEIESRYIHLAGISNTEFSLDLIRHLRSLNAKLSLDMQSFVRQVNPQTREIEFLDVESKREIVSLMDMVKLDIVEAKILTGTDDMRTAAAIIQSWGCKEIVITQAEGAHVRIDGTHLFEPFSNRSVVGRTGRGDTTFAAYLATRIDYNAQYALKFAAALVSIKMESPGPFSGTIEDVLERMEQKTLGRDKYDIHL